MSKHIRKSHNVSLILFHLVCPIKYRKSVLDKDTTDTLKNICWGIGQRYEIRFVEIGADEDHVHFLIQSVPTFSPTKIARTIKSITGREMFERHPDLKHKLWGSHFWTSGFYVNTVGASADENTIKQYVQNQGKQYNLFHQSSIEEHAVMYSY